jgi:hypothetical protein
MSSFFGGVYGKDGEFVWLVFLRKYLGSRNVRMATEHEDQTLGIDIVAMGKAADGVVTRVDFQIKEGHTAAERGIEEWKRAVNNGWVLRVLLIGEPGTWDEIAASIREDHFWVGKDVTNRDEVIEELRSLRAEAVAA